MQLKFKKLHREAKLPSYATENAAGMDLSARIDGMVQIKPGESAIVPTGVAIEVPDGYEAVIRGRSGLAFNNAIFAFNGTIDADFRGEVKVLLTNHSNKSFLIEPGMRIAQIVVNAAVVKCRPEFVDKLSETARGEDGFGSTGLSEPKLTRKSDMGYVDAKDVMYDTCPDQQEIKDKLLNHNKGL